MKMNLRKEQEKLAVLLEISDTPKKNSDVIKGAESRIVMDEAYSVILLRAMVLNLKLVFSLRV